MLTQVFFVSLLVTLAATPAAIAILRRFGVVDIPNERSSHTATTVRGVGWGPAAGTVAGCAVAGVFYQEATWLAALAVLLGLVGFADDMRRLPAGLRLGLQVVIAAGAITWGVVADSLAFAAPAMPFVVMAVVAYVNAFNFMDGVNGISAGQGMAVGAMLALGGVAVDSIYLQIGGLAVAASCIGFLPFNAVRPKGFLGDIGSYFLGGWLSGLGLFAVTQGTGVVFLFALAAPYAADTGWTVVRRLRRGQRVWEAHRDHVYQRLTSLGLSHQAVAMLVTVLTILCGASGLFAIDSRSTTALLVLLGTGALCVAYVSLPTLLLHAQGRSGWGSA